MDIIERRYFSSELDRISVHLAAMVAHYRKMYAGRVYESNNHKITTGVIDCAYGTSFDGYGEEREQMDAANNFTFSVKRRHEQLHIQCPRFDGVV